MKTCEVRVIIMCLHMHDEIQSFPLIQKCAFPLLKIVEFL